MRVEDEEAVDEEAIVRLRNDNLHGVLWVYIRISTSKKDNYSHTY